MNTSADEQKREHLDFEIVAFASEMIDLMVFEL
jgi:hypothetical protein